MATAPDTLRLRTAENVGIDYRVAGLGSRFIARLIDEIILLLLEIGTVLLASVVVSALFSGSPNVTLIVILLVVLVLFARSMYFLFLEWAMNGQTPGKRALGIRVVRQAGGGIGFTESFIRNLFRLVDDGPIAALSMFIDRKSRRLGDLAAGTLVVHERRPSRAGPYGGGFSAPPVYLATRDTGEPITGIAGLGQREHSLLQTFLSRADLHPMQRHLLATEMARKLCDRMALSADAAERSLPPEIVVERVYLQLSERLGARA